MTPETEPVMRATLYPAHVTLPDGTAVRLAKLVLTQDRVYVFTTASVDGSVFTASYTDADIPNTLAPRSARWSVTTDTGTLTARRLPGCGCSSSALKRFQPFTPERWTTV